MKKIIVLFFIVFASIANAQITKDSLLKKMANEACIEISKKDFSKMNVDNMEQEMGVLLMPAIIGNMSDIEKVYGTKITNEEGMQKVGQDLAMKLIMSCPEFMKMSMEMGKDPSSMEKLQKKAKIMGMEKSIDVESSDEIKGTLISFTPADISSILVKDKSGKTSKLYWMEYFENADDFMSNSKKYLNKKVVVNYIVRDIYDAAKKAYKAIKVIASLELQ
jgi:hypothetical protein